MNEPVFSNQMNLKDKDLNQAVIQAVSIKQVFAVDEYPPKETVNKQQMRNECSNRKKALFSLSIKRMTQK